MKFLILSFLLLFVACKKTDSSTDVEQRKKTEEMVAEANRRLGLPNITNFTEKRFQKMIYELRDQEVATYSYFMDMNGNLHLLCESIGYGLPASVQYVSPEKKEFGRYRDQGLIGMPQPEPNGLFMPDSLDATYVLCTDKDGKVHPVYSEPKLIVSPFPLKHAGDIRK